MAKLLIIDDSELVLQMLQMVCEQAGHDVVAVTNMPEALVALEKTPPDAVITDLNMPSTDDPVADLRASCDVPIVVVSGQSQESLDAIAAERGADGAISKDAGMMGMAATLPDLLGRLL